MLHHARRAGVTAPADGHAVAPLEAVVVVDGYGAARGRCQALGSKYSEVVIVHHSALLGEGKVGSDEPSGSVELSVGGAGVVARSAHQHDKNLRIVQRLSLGEPGEAPAITIGHLVQRLEDHTD